jgi:hypothetical protein
MHNYSGMLESDSQYGKVLENYSTHLSKLSEEQNHYQTKIRDGFGASLSHSMVEYKDYATLKKKVESRRLDFDSKVSKAIKSKKEKPEDEEAVRVSQMRYEDSITDVTSKMLNLHNVEDEQLDDLLDFIDAQQIYYQKGADLTKEFQEKVQSIVEIIARFGIFLEMARAREIR